MPEKRYDRVRLPSTSDTAQREPPRAVTRRPDTNPRLVQNSPVVALLRRIAGPTVRRKARLDAFAAPPQVEQSLQSSRGNGQPLPSPARERMESAFGASFEGVSLHTDSDADHLTRQVDAVAFTHGRDIYFSSGSFAPESSGGQKLLAHELTHVVQQRSGRKVTVGAAYDPAEAEADQMADAVVQRLQRQQTRQTVPGDAVAREDPSEEEMALVRRQESTEEEEIQMVRRQSEGDAEEELVEPLRRQEEEELAQPLRRQESDEEEEEVQAVRRQSDAEDEEEALEPMRRQEEEEEAQPLRRQEEEELAQPLRRAPNLGSAAAAATPGPAVTAASAPTTQEDPAGEQSETQAVRLYRQGVEAYRAGDLPQAIALWQRVVGHDEASESNRANAIWNIGRAYQDQGNDRAALTMYRTFMAQPSVSGERLAVAQGIVERLEREQAGSAAQTESEKPNDAQGAGKVTNEPKALPSAPEQRGQALQGLADQAYENGAYAKALEHFQQLMHTAGLEQQVYGQTLFNMGQCYRRLGNDAAAINMYRGFIAQPTASPEARALAQQLIAKCQH